LAQAAGLALLVEQGVLLPGQCAALLGQAGRLIDLYRAKHVELVIQVFKIEDLFGGQGVGLFLHLQGGLAQGREQVVVGAARDFLADQVELVVEVLHTGVFSQQRHTARVADRRRRSLREAGQRSAQHQQGEQPGEKRLVVTRCMRLAL